MLYPKQNKADNVTRKEPTPNYVNIMPRFKTKHHPTSPALATRSALSFQVVSRLASTQQVVGEHSLNVACSCLTLPPASFALLCAAGWLGLMPSIVYGLVEGCWGMREAPELSRASHLPRTWVASSIPHGSCWRKWTPEMWNTRSCIAHKKLTIYTYITLIVYEWFCIFHYCAWLQYMTTVEILMRIVLR